MDARREMHATVAPNCEHHQNYVSSPEEVSVKSDDDSEDEEEDWDSSAVMIPMNLLYTRC